MKILIITPHFWPENFRVNDMANYLSEKNYDVSVLTSIPNYPKGFYFKDYGIFKNRYQNYKNIKIHRLIVVPRRSGNFFWLVLNYFSFVFFSFYKIFKLRKKNFDAIIVYQISPITVAIPALVLKFLIKKPIFLWILDLWPESINIGLKLKNNFFNVLFYPLIKFIYSYSDKILVSSKGFKKSILNKKINANKLLYLPQWSETIFNFIKNKNHDLKFINKNDFVIMFAGNLGEAQDFDSILSCIKNLKKNTDIKWIFIGNGRKKKYFQNKIINENLSNQVFFIEPQPIESMPYYYSQADLMFISLKNDPNLNLTVPAKFQSYLASGMPILGMIGGQVKTIIQSSNCGVVVDPGNYEKLTKEIINLKESSKYQINIMKMNAFNYYKKHYVREKVLEKLERIITSI